MTKEKNILSVLADNPALQEALKGLLVKHFEAATPTLRDDTSDVALGQFLRSKIAGLKAVDEALKEITQYKTLPTTPPRENPAR